MSELLCKETIDTNTYRNSTGRSGSYSTNYQNAGRELMTPDEVRQLDNRYALLFIRGERPVMDLKYNLLKHPNLALTTDGGAAAYRHGEVTMNTATITALSVERIVPTGKSGKNGASKPEITYVLLSEEEAEERYGGKVNEQQTNGKQKNGK